MEGAKDNHTGQELYPAITLGFIITMQVLVTIACALSIFGAALIIVTYGVFRDLRTTARQLLLNLSVADILVAASHIVGVHANFKRFLRPYNSHWDTLTMNPGPLCTIQGAFTMCGTLASFLWTLALALFMFVIIVMRKPGIAQKLVFVFYPVCWGVPIVLTVAFGAAGYLGFEESADVAWCYLRQVPESRHSERNETNYQKSALVDVAGYDVWIWVTFVLLAVLYVTMHCHLRCRPPSHRVQTPDLKLIFVPLIFLLLRVWSAIIDIYAYLDDFSRFKESWPAAILLILAGVGDSTQGFANAILFCVFTKPVRRRLFSPLRTACLSPRPHENSETFICEDSTMFDSEHPSRINGDETNPLLISQKVV